MHSIIYIYVRRGIRFVCEKMLCSSSKNKKKKLAAICKTKAREGGRERKAVCVENRNIYIDAATLRF